MQFAWGRVLFTGKVFKKLLEKLSKILPKGSSVVFDYPDDYTYTDHAADRVKKQVAMAGMANETMAIGYSYKGIEKLLSDNDFLITHLKDGYYHGRYAFSRW